VAPEVLSVPVPTYWKGALKLGSDGLDESVMRKAYVPEGRPLGVKVSLVPVTPAVRRVSGSSSQRERRATYSERS